MARNDECLEYTRDIVVALVQADKLGTEEAVATAISVIYKALSETTSGTPRGRTLMGLSPNTS